MAFVSRGFVGRPEARERTGLLPPGQYDIGGSFPVLSTGPTPRTALEDWDFTISGEVDEPERLTWQEFQDLPHEEVTVDIHCVTKWSKFETTWSGVSLDTLLDRVETSADYLLAFCDGGYTTNLPLEDVTGGRAWIVDARTVRRVTSPRFPREQLVQLDRGGRVSFPFRLGAACCGRWCRSGRAGSRGSARGR
jgi:DMSO/TMAO reductase YedYZ molybdopterin-dependent catalytic subunit